MSLPSLFDYLPSEEAHAILKFAAVEEKPPPKFFATLAKGALGFGGGTILGFGASAAANQIHKKVYGTPIPSSLLGPAATLVGGGMGIAYSLYKSKEQEDLRRAYEAYRNRPKGGVPRK